MTFDAGKWIGGLAEWTDGDVAYLSVAFTWKLNDAYQRAIYWRSLGYTVRAGGPGIFTRKHFLADVAEIGGDLPDAVSRHNPMATIASKGCPVGCWFCIVPKMEGKSFTLKGRNSSGRGSRSVSFRSSARHASRKCAGSKNFAERKQFSHLRERGEQSGISRLGRASRSTLRLARKAKAMTKDEEIKALAKKARAATMGFDWSDLPDDADVPAIPLLRQLADALESLSAQVEEQRAHLALIKEQSEPFLRAIADCQGAQLPSWLTTAQLQQLFEAIGADDASSMIFHRWEAAYGVLSDYYSEVSLYEHEHETLPCVINPGTRHRAEAVMADNPKWGLEMFGLYDRLQARAEATERRLAEVEAERDHWLNEARQNLKNGQNAVDRADRLESALRAAKDAIWSGCDTISATKAIDAALSGSSDPRKDVARRCVEIAKSVGEIQSAGWRDNPRKDGCGGEVAASNTAHFIALDIASEFALDTKEGTDV